jgi:hypothetical protein
MRGIQAKGEEDLNAASSAQNMGYCRGSGNPKRIQKIMKSSNLEKLEGNLTVSRKRDKLQDASLHHLDNREYQPFSYIPLKLIKTE